MKINRQSLKVSIFLISIIFVLVWATRYFMVDVVKYDMYSKTYDLVASSSNQYNLVATNHTDSIFFPNEQPLKVYIKEDNNRTIEINGDIYSVRAATESEAKDLLSMNNHIVTYPDGKQYIVEDALMWYDYIPGKGRVLNEISYLNSMYAPSFLVTASYEQYFSKQGNLKLFIGSFVLFFVSLAVILFKKCQMYLFNISYLFVEEPTPTAFYFIFCKIVMAVSMFYACILFFKSL